MQTTKCPGCNSDLIVEDEAYEGDIMDCSNCTRELEIVSLHPLQVSELANDETDEGEDTLDE